MQRDGLNSSLNFSEYIKTLSEIETEDLNVKLNSCGYQSSDEVSDLLNTVEIIWVNTHQPTHKSVQIPDDIRKKLEKFLINQT